MVINSFLRFLSIVHCRSPFPPHALAGTPLFHLSHPQTQNAGCLSCWGEKQHWSQLELTEHACETFKKKMVNHGCANLPQPTKLGTSSKHTQHAIWALTYVSLPATQKWKVMTLNKPPTKKSTPEKNEDIKKSSKHFNRRGGHKGHQEADRTAVKCITTISLIAPFRRQADKTNPTKTNKVSVHVIFLYPCLA